MEQKHRDLINKNFTSLVEQTNLDYLLPILLEKEVFSDKMIEPYMDSSKDAKSRKLKMYLDIQRRGPKAFDKLIESLQEIGHWDLLRLLSPEHILSIPFISLKNKSNKMKKPPMGESSSYRPPEIRNNEFNNGIEDNVPIVVKKSTKFGVSHNTEILCYSMKSRKRGVLLMINNVQFENNIEKYREGALKDQENLKELFTQIGFHKIIIHNNKTKQEMEKLLSDFANSDVLKRTDCLFVVISSHGMARGSCDTNIITSDGDSIPTNNILELFNNKNCHLLHNIPKVFVFQVCRGDVPDYGIKSETKKEANNRTQPANSRTQSDGKSENVTMRTYSDMLIAHSTVPGFSSHRDIILGSWYMISLCKVFMEHAHHSHLDDLFRLVDAHLKDIYLKQNSIQTSSIENRGFNKYCYLNPGLFEN